MTLDRLESRAAPEDIVVHGGVVHVGLLRFLGAEDDPSAHAGYASRSESGVWAIETVQAGDGALARGARVAVAADGTPVLAYNLANDTLWVGARASGAGWTLEQVSADAAESFDLAVDPSGRAHLVWAPASANGAYAVYARKEGSSWMAEAVYGCGTHLAIAVASSGEPVVACHGPDGGAVIMFRTAAGWIGELVSDGSDLVPARGPADTGLAMDVALDASDSPHVYFSTRRGTTALIGAMPHYAIRSSAGWTVEAVDRETASSGEHGGLALDAAGLPHVAYLFVERVGGVPADPVLHGAGDVRYAVPVRSLVAGGSG